MADKDTTSIDKFQEASQWTSWKFQVKVILKAAEIFDVVTGDEPKPTEDAAKEFVTKLVEWKKKDNRAQKVIVTSIGQRVMMHILNCNTSKEMWDKLKSVYEQDNAAAKQLLHERFISFRMNPNDDVATHISKLEDIAQKMRGMKMEVSDQMLITKILMTLPVEFRSFVSAWDLLDEGKRTVTNLTNQLLIEESRNNMCMHRVTAESSEAFMTKSSGGNAKKGNQQKEKYKGKRKGNCFNCGSSEHWKSQCPNKRSGKLMSGELRSNKSKAGSSNDKALVANTRSKLNNCSASSNETTLLNSVMRELKEDEAWFNDSGASSHISNELRWFINYKLLNEPKEVTLADGKIMRGIGFGDILIMSFTGTEWIQKTLANVLYSPDVFANLFSLTSALDNGHEFYANRKKCRVIDGDDTVAVGVRESGLFRMLFKVIEPSTNNKVCANIAVKCLPLRVWHERLGHQHIAHVRKHLKDRAIDFIDENFDCDGCAYGKQHRLSFELRQERSTTCGQIIHADVCGAIEVNSLAGSKYFIVFKDDYSHYRFVFFLKHKSEVVDKMKLVINMIEKQFDHSIKALQSDNGTEFVNEEMCDLLQQHGIRHRRSVPYAPEQNGCIERENRTIMESARSMIHAKGLTTDLWAEAVHTAVYVLNRTGTSSIKDKTPYELWHGKSAKIDHLRIFGSKVYVHVPKQRRRKLDKKANICTFVGYEDDIKGYRVMDQYKVVKVARDVNFLSEEPVTKATIEIDSIEKINSDDGDASSNNQEPDTSQGEDQFDDDNVDDDQTKHAETRKAAKMSRRRPTTLSGMDEHNIMKSRLRNNTGMFALLASAIKDEDEPKTYQEAIDSPNSNNWLEAMKDEMESLQQNSTWILVDRPANQKVVDCKWVYKLKRNPDESMERFKARLVARGFTQEYGIDYSETFSPVARFTSIRAILAIAAKRRLLMQQFDIKTAFLYGDLDECVYMKQANGFDDGSGRVYKLQKSLYGLKQASRCWNQKFTNFIEKYGFVTCESDPCVFVSNKNKQVLILAIYVDDGLIIGSDKASILSVVQHLRGAFEVKSMEVGCFLGIQIQQKGDGTIFINQAAYARKILRKFQLEDCHALCVPSDPDQVLSKFEEADECDYPYRQLIGSLMYLSVATRPDITYAVGLVSRYMERPTKLHVDAAKRILRYVKGTVEFGIMYSSIGEEKLNGYSDSDYAGCVDTRYSTSGSVFMFDCGIISWKSERQRSVSLSTMEAEYIAASDAVKELIWLKRLLNQLLPGGFDNVDFYMDNQSAIRLVKNPEFHKRSKHIDVRYHFIRDEYQKEVFNLHNISSNNMIADVMTKALRRDRFQYLRSMMGIGSDNA